MIKKYIVPPLDGLQVGDLVRYEFPHKPIISLRHGSTGLIIDINTETNSTFCYDSQTVISNEHTVYTVYWQQDIPGYPSESFETEKYLFKLWSSSDITELASRLGLTEIESEVAGSINYKYGE